MLEGEEPEPDRRPDGAGNRDGPAGRKPRVEKRRAPIERRPRAPKYDEDERENRRFLVVGALEQRGDDARGDRGDGQHPRPIEAARQTLRQKEQRGSRDAPEEMRRFDDAERQEAIPKSKAPNRRRSRTGE